MKVARELISCRSPVVCTVQYQMKKSASSGWVSATPLTQEEAGVSFLLTLLVHRFTVLLVCSLATHQKLPFDDALPW